MKTDRRQQAQTGPHDELGTAAVREWAAAAALVAGLALIPWWLLSGAVVDAPDAPAPSGSDAEFVAYYTENVTELAWTATLFVVQWTLVLTVVVGVVRAACRRLDMAAILTVALAGAATAVYVAAEGVMVWPVVQSDHTQEAVGSVLEAGVARALVASRDGLHAPAAVLLGISVLVAGWLLLRSRPWGHWFMAALSAVAGGFALTSVVVGPEGFGPGFILILWAWAVPLLALLGLRRSGPHQTASAE
jgi:hypothetical protein